MRLMRRIALLVSVLAMVVAAVACVPPNPGASGLYLGPQADIHPVVTAKDKPITWGAAPAIDSHYGGILYEGTSSQMPDPRPALLPGGQEPLRMWMADPNNGLTNRPAIVWLHGGGFAVGIDSMYGLANGTGKDYAQRGYVSFSVEYRTDTTLMGDQRGENRPASLCQWVQDHENPGDSTWEAAKAQCQRNIQAAQYDALASVRYLRANAVKYGIDPNRIVVGGFSAGAVTAANTAYQSDDVGTVKYFPGDNLSAASKPQAAIGASGCTYADSLNGVPSTIGAGDSPISFIHSRYDAAVPYECVATTVTTARSKGLVAELTSYCNENGHADKLYAAHKAATDEQWTTFMARELGLYTGMRPPSADPVCA